MKPVAGKCLVQILKKRGWILQCVNGSHHYFIHPNSRFPVNELVHGTKALKPKTQCSIMKAAGLTDDAL